MKKTTFNGITLSTPPPLSHGKLESKAYVCILMALGAGCPSLEGVPIFLVFS